MSLTKSQSTKLGTAAAILVAVGIGWWLFDSNQKQVLCLAEIKSVPTSSNQTENAYSVVVESDRRAIRVINKETNQTVWKKDILLPQVLTDDPTIVGSKLLARTLKQQSDSNEPTNLFLTAYDLRSGNEDWIFQYSGHYYDIMDVPAGGSAAVYVQINAPDRVYGSLVALDSASGKELWKIDEEEHEFRSLAVSNDTAYLLGETVTAYNLATRKLVWNYDPRRFLESYKVENFEANDKFVGFEFAAYPSRIYRLDAKTGKALAICKGS